MKLHKLTRQKLKRAGFGYTLIRKFHEKLLSWNMVNGTQCEQVKKGTLLKALQESLHVSQIRIKLTH